MQIPVREDAVSTITIRQSAERVVIVNEKLARTFLAGTRSLLATVRVERRPWFLLSEWLETC